MSCVALEIPLSALDLAGLVERHHSRAARVEVFHEAFDRTALAGRIAPLEQNDDPLARLLDPGLQFQQLDLQVVFLALVAFP